MVEGRVEVFNLLNATNFDEYVGSLLAGLNLYARPITAFPPRRIQLAAIVRF
jgi:hypothetical protein